MQHPDSVTGISPAVQLEIEALLGEVERAMEPVLPDHRNELINEMRAHLYAMLAARISDGQSESAAWTATQRAFGDGTTIGHDLTREWMCRPRIETQGDPLSGHEKTVLLGKRFSLLLVFSLGLGFGFPLLSAYGLDTVLSLLAFAGMSIYTLRHQLNQLGYTGWTPMKKWVVAVPILAAITVWLNFQTHHWSFGGDYCLIVWNFAVAIVAAVVTTRVRREKNWARSWRQSLRYRQSPVAAEAEYRLGLLIHRVAAFTLLGCVIAWMYIPVLGLGTAIGAMACCLAIGFSVVRSLK